MQNPKGEVIHEPKLASALAASNSEDLQSSENAIDEILPAPLQEQSAKGSQKQNIAPKDNAKVQAPALTALETGAKNAKDSKEEKKQKTQKPQSAESSAKPAQSQSAQSQALSLDEPAQNLAAQEQEEAPSFAEMLMNGGKKKGEKAKDEPDIESKPKASANKQSLETAQSAQAQRTQILYRSAQAKQSLRNFAQSLREEVLNYKPPITKLSLELNPQNLGTLELTITKKGKDLHIQVLSNATAIGLFLQNQADFKANLTQVGFNNVDLSFASNEGGGGGSGTQRQNNQAAEQEEGNKNSLEDLQSNEMQVMNITLPKYA